MTAPTPDAQANSADSQPTSSEYQPIAAQSLHYMSTGAPPQDHSPQPNSSGRSILPWAIAAVIALLGIAGTVTGFVLYSGEHRSLTDARATADQLRQQVSSGDARRAAAQRAACDFVTLLGTVDYANFDQHVAAVMGASTGGFHQDFSVASAAMRDKVTTDQVRNSITESHCGLASLAAQSAQVIVIATQSSTNNSSPNPQLANLRMIVTADEQPGGRWLVSNVSVMS